MPRIKMLSIPAIRSGSDLVKTIRQDISKTFELKLDAKCLSRHLLDLLDI